MNKIISKVLLLLGFVISAEINASTFIASLLEEESQTKKLSLNRTSVLGDAYDPISGSVSFSVTDISIPGSSDLPVELKRTYAVNSGSSDGLIWLGNWSLDIPSIRGYYLKQGGGTVIVEGNGWHNGKVCTADVSSKITASSYSGPGWEYPEPQSYWQGKFLHIPNETSEPLLMGTGVFSGKQITKSNHYVSSCFQRTDGNGEGVVVSAPDGKKYTFGYSVDDVSRVGPSNAYRYKKNLLITRVEDRFGNYVSYNYVGRELRSIVASDGRAIYLNYNASTRVATVTAGDRSWLYKLHSSINQIQEVQLPDGRKWIYSLEFYRQSSPATHIYSSVSDSQGYCDKTAYGSTATVRSPIVFSVVTPDRVTITYTVKDIYHGRANTPILPVPSWQNLMLKMYNCQVRQNLIAKTISGPGVSPQQWSYSYSENRGSYGNLTPVSGAYITFPFSRPATVPDGLAIKTTTVSGPDSRSIYYIDRRAISSTEDSILAIDTTDVAQQTLLKREEKYYANLASSLRVGAQWDLQTGNIREDKKPELRLISNSDRVEYRLNTTKAIERLYYAAGSNSYTKEFSNFDIYGKPEQTKEYNSFSVWVRYLSQFYLNDSSANWLLGLPTTTRMSSDGSNWTTVSENTYHPWTQGAGYQLQLKDQFAYGQRIKTVSQYHTDGNIKRIEWPGANRWVDYSNYKRGHAQTIATPQHLSSVAQYAYKVVDDNGWVKSFTDFKGAVTNYEYDSIGDLVAVIPGNSQWATSNIEYSYATTSDQSITGVSAGMLIQKITRGGYRKNTYYDALLRPLVTSEEDLSNSSTKRYIARRFDSSGNNTFESYPSGVVGETKGIHIKYDPLSRKIKTTHDSSVGQVSATTTYMPGNKIELTDFKNYKTTTSYLAYGVPAYEAATNIASPESVNTGISYNLFGKPSSITQGGITQYNVYDAAQRICKQVRPDIGNVAFSYNTAGEVEWTAHSSSVDSSTTSCDYTVDANDKVTNTYDNQGNVRTQIYGDGTPTKIYGFDKNNNLTRLDFGNLVQQYVYGDINNLTSESTTIDGQTRTLGYQYNNLGHVSAITYPNNHRVEFIPNAFGQATLVRNSTAAITYASNIIYHPSGAINTYNYGNGLRYSLAQNQQRLPESISVRNSSNTLLVGFTYGYDNNFNINNITDNHVAAYSIAMTYDGLNRLKTASSNWGSGIFNYDSLGNIQNYNLGSFGITYNYDSNKQLQSVVGSKTYNFAYDERGNVTKNTATGNTFAYNLANQMTGIGTNLYRYDGHNRRVKKQSSQGTEYFTYAKAGTFLHTQKTNGVNQNYIYLGNSLIAKVDNTTTSYVHTDHLGSVVAESNSAGQITKRFHYKPFGETLETQQDDVGYTGHKHDSDLGLTYMQARYYDPVLGRFYGNDPVGYLGKNPVMSFNRYLYVNNNPYKYTDPNGEFAWFAALLFIGAGVTATAPANAPGPNDTPQQMSGIDAVAAVIPAARLESAAVKVAENIAANSTVNAVLKNGDSLPTDKALDAAIEHLGEGYSEVASGVFKSADGKNMVRMTDSDLAKTNNHAGAPHINLETGNTVTKPNGKESFNSKDNKHIYLPEEK